MGPRPSRPGPATLMAQPIKAVELVPRRDAHSVEFPSAPLPMTISSVLAAIVRDMRDVPRDCLVDRAELLFWLRRMANRVEGVGRMGVPVSPDLGISRRLAQPAEISAHSSTSRDLVEAVFGKGSRSTRAPGPRTIISRRGQSVRVEVRRARAGGQLELGL